ncbi:MAG: hypothetical protein ABW146_07175 [Candidatus Sedimenticola sp. 6PFRAG7]
MNQNILSEQLTGRPMKIARIVNELLDNKKSQKRRRNNSLKHILEAIDAKESRLRSRIDDEPEGGNRLRLLKELHVLQAQKRKGTGLLEQA